MIPTQKEWEENLINRHGLELFNRFQNSTVAICGLGGLGSNIAISLARAGIGHLVLIDFDKVDISNLHRQQYNADQIGIAKAEAITENLKKINPYIKLTPIICKLTPDNIETILKDADVICEAFDRPEAKAMLVDTVFEKLPGTFLVSGSGMASMRDPNLIKTRKIAKNFYLSGDETSDVKDNSLFAPRVMLCAAHEALTVLRLLAGETI